MEMSEPYRATKLWNEVIQAFKHGMPLKKHRRKIYSFSDCFTASDAVTWLHCYLMNNPNFGLDVTRQQTINLLGKFLKCHVIEAVSNRGKKCEFFDNSRLYRFTELSPQQLKSCIFHPVQSPLVKEKGPALKYKDVPKTFERCHKSAPELHQKENIPECLFIERKMTLFEIGALWKNSVLERLQGELNNDLSLNDIIDEESISGHVAKHNSSRISKTGVVTLIDKTDDIPHWVVSAMKCLANWPNASGSGSCLPNYPGFEKDVFKVVRDFFINPNVPLIPENISSPMFVIFCYFLKEQLDLLADMKNSTQITELSSLKNASASSEIKTSTPVLCLHNSQSSKTMSSSESSHGKLLLDDPEVMWDYPAMPYYETDFASSDPVTKMVSNLGGSSTLIYDPLHSSMESVSTISMCTVSSNNKGLHDANPATPLKNWNSDSCLQTDKRIGCQSLQLQRNPSSENVALHRHSMFDYLSLPFADNDSLNDSICSSKTLTPESNRNSLVDPNACNEGTFISTIDKPNNLSAIKNQNLSSPVPAYEASFINSCSKKFENFTFPDQLKASLQLLLLFLLPPNRRQLHLLLRVLNKILKNQQFSLDIKIPMRDYLLQTFLPAILPSNDNPAVIFGMAFFLLENCETLLSPPSGLKEKIEAMCKLRSGKIVFSVDDASYLTYCEMVSKQQYEEQRIAMSHEALRNLLVLIMKDQNLSDKERKKRLKQFKENHPDIYYELFPGKPSFQRSKSSFFNRFANLRM